jgi:hypothetical protein
MQEVLSQGTILRQRDYFRADGLCKVLVEHLFSVSLVLTGEYIAKHGKAGNMIQVQFFDARMNSEIILSRVNLILS